MNCHNRFFSTPAESKNNICDKIGFVGAGNMAKVYAERARERENLLCCCW